VAELVYAIVLETVVRKNVKVRILAESFMKITSVNLDIIDATEIIPEGCDDFFSEFLCNADVAWGGNDYTLLSASAFAEYLVDYIAYRQESLRDDLYLEKPTLKTLKSIINKLDGCPEGTFVNLEA
jgi:hypothetical protein